ncbi:MAG: SDR family oxidoreductase [Acidobacteria bacterium]|nr:SDR family oxidoreductase [Acidobacteriota bacterium]
MTRLPGERFQDLPVLVTGGAGFIGSHLVDRLVDLGGRVRVLDDLSTGRRENLAGHLAAGRIELLEGDLCDLDTCRRAVAGSRLVFHQAALGSVPRSLEEPARSLEVNVGGTANLFTASRDASVDRVVYASSSSVYGDSESLPKREGEEGKVLSPYALSKRMDEQLAELFGDCFTLELVGLRYFNVYGPRQDPAGAYAAVIPRFFRAFAEGVAPTIYGDGEQSRDFTFVGDAVAANLLAATAPSSACGQAYNVGGGHRTTVNELAEAVCRIAGGPPGLDRQPAREGDVLHSLADLSLARAQLGYEPSTSLEEGLERSAEHYKSLFAERIS